MENAAAAQLFRVGLTPDAEEWLLVPEHRLDMLGQ
jgi:hypothetical protein